MNTFTSIKDILSYYDTKERKQFLFEEVSASISSLPKENLESKICAFEELAFDFAEDCYGNVWGTYYGPQWTFRNKDTGEDVYVPDIKNVTEETITYWEQRANEAINPLLKMRYSGLVFEFKKELLNLEADYRTVKIAHIKSLIDVINGDYCKYETNSLEYGERALELSIRIKNKDLQQQSVKSYFSAHKRYSANDMQSGIWGMIFHSLIKHPECFVEYESELLVEQLNRFERLKKQSMEYGTQTDRYVHVLSDQIDLLSDYYHFKGENIKIEPLLDTMLDAIKKSIPLRGGMWGQSMIQILQKKYRKFGFDKRANQLYVEMSDLGSLTLSELKTTEFTVPLEKERIEVFFNEAFSGTQREALLYFLVQYLPIIDEEKKRLQEKAEQSPLLDLVSTFTIDTSGNAISRVGIGKDADRQKLYFSMYENMKFTSPLMHLHIIKMKEREIMTTETMMQLIEGSGLIPEGHKAIVRKGFDAYLSEDYVVCCHLLVPQLETAIRRLFSLNGVNVMRPKRNPEEGNEYISLDSLLSSEKAISFMNEDVANYFRNVLTDQYGWNIRNLVCHGLIDSDGFNYVLADRLVHAFLMLGGFSNDINEDVTNNS